MIRFISYGGGVQSTALLVLAAQQRINYPDAVMANVGDDSENPATLEYVRTVAKPWAEQHGIRVHVLNRTRPDGSTETLWGRMMKENSKRLPIPVRGMNGAPFKRSCTHDFKIEVTGKWAKQQGASEENPATVAIGISLDEIHRANNKRAESHETIVYPLIGIGDETGFHYTRTDCARIITDAGLPVPPKSACFFCPFHRPSAWQDLRRDEPALFNKAARLEATLNKRQLAEGKPPVYLTRFGMPLKQAIPDDDQPLLPLLDQECDGGWCHT